MILIIGSHKDDHVQTVCRYLSASNYIVFNPWDHDTSAWSLAVEAQRWDGTLHMAGKSIAFTDITAAWWRLKQYELGGRIADLPATDRDFVVAEWLGALEALEYMFPAVPWMSRRSLEQTWHLKSLQLCHAQRFGFTIPATRITNHYNTALAFLNQPGEHICKFNNPYIGETGEGLHTSLVTSAQLEKDAAAMAFNPSIYQDRIDKAYELRVTVVGESVFATKIHSQNVAAARLDYRHASDEVVYEAITLDATLQEKLLAFHHATGLGYGAYDFIVEAGTGDHYFLEVNPAGQWLWLEDATGQPISAAVAHYLQALSRNYAASLVQASHNARRAG